MISGYRQQMKASFRNRIEYGDFEAYMIEYSLRKDG